MKDNKHYKRELEDLDYDDMTPAFFVASLIIIILMAIVVVLFSLAVAGSVVLIGASL